MEPIYRRVAGVDVHRMKQVVTVLTETEAGQVKKATREFGGFRRDLEALVAWLQAQQVELVVMESTGIYWKSLFAHLEAAGLLAWVVNAHHVKQVPGRKTDVADSEWLAQLARFGLVRTSFIPPRDLRELRLVGRYRRKLAAVLSGEKNRLHKLLDDAGIKLGGVVADINGVTARALLAGLIAGHSPTELAGLGGRLRRASRADLEAALEGELSARHRLVLEAAQRHIRALEDELERLDRYLFEAMRPYEWAWRLLQTIPGIDALMAALILIEIGLDMERFGSPERIASWTGLCPGNHESAGKRKHGRTRHGNPVVRSLLCEAANAARRTPSVFKAKYDSLVLRRGHKRAVIAIAHKLIRTIFVVLARRQPYRDSGLDYEAASVAKNAPRWIRALKKFGYWPEAAAA